MWPVMSDSSNTLVTTLKKKSKQNCKLAWIYETELCELCLLNFANSFVSTIEMVHSNRYLFYVHIKSFIKKYFRLKVQKDRL